MTDPLSWSVNLGRWAGTRVRVHVLLLFFAINKLLDSAWAKDRPGGAAATLGWLALLMLVLALKALAQGLMARRVGIDRDEVRLWPLGHLGGPGLTMGERSPEAVAVTVAGLAMNFALAMTVAVGLGLARVGMVFNPFGNAGTGGAPILAGAAAPTFTLVWWVGWFGYLNWVVFVANLIPALPLDGGRIFRPIMAARSRDGMIGPWTAHSCAAILGVIGLVRWIYLLKPGGPELVGLAILIELMVRAEARLMEEGGFFDDGMFGYDFSQGYTSLEAGAATVRPPREGALKRWRRRRSEVRRRRREAAEAADERRMDAILEKIHRDGRSSLSEDEQRFLVRVSVKYRSASRATDVAASRLRDAMGARPLVLDAAMGTRLIARGLDLRADDPALWNLSRPDVVREIHAFDVAAGADAITTNTFGANRPSLDRLGHASDLAAINRLSVALAREAAGPDRLVLGSIGPEAASGVERGGERCPSYREQAGLLIDFGVDALLIETHSWDQAALALRNLDGKATAILVCLTSWPDEPEALRGKSATLRSLGAAAIGTNCASIESVIGWTSALSGQLAAPLIARPSAGLPGGPLASPEDFAAMARRAVASGARLLGGCCGTDDRHVAAIHGAIASP